jgi:hypothetical protein
MSSSSSKAEAVSFHEPEKTNDANPPPLNRSRSVKHKITHLAVQKSKLFNYSIAFFFALQVFYIILAAFCLSKPIPLGIRLGLSDAEIIGGYTVIFVVWQKVAIGTGQYIADEILEKEKPEESPHAESSPEAPYSEGSPTTEKARLAMEKQKIAPLVLGFIPWHVIHISRGKSSKTFKLAFLASASIFALSSLAPGMINAATMLLDVPTNIQIGRLFSHPADNETQEVFTAQSRANLILRLEMIEHSPFGFKLPPNMLAPVPKVELTSFNGTIEYDTDIIEFHHDCHWEAPQYFNVSSSIIVAAAGQQWAGATVGAGQIIIGSSIGSLSLVDFPTEERVGLVAFIFSGGNSSVLDRRFNPPAPYAVDLTSIPTTFTAEGAGLALDTNSVYAPLSSVLVCDPRPQISGGRVSVTNDGTLTVVSSGKTPIGNIPESAANLIFTNALQTATVQVETFATTNAVNNVVAKMFMANSTAVNWESAQGVVPLDLPSINQNMDTFMLSAAKAFIDGYRKNGTGLAVDFELDTVPAMGQQESLALSVSTPLFSATNAFVVIVTVLLIVLRRYI